MVLLPGSLKNLSWLCM